MEKRYGLYGEEKSKDEVFADALIRILENQKEIKKHLGVGDYFYYDDKQIERLETID